MSEKNISAFDMAKSYAEENDLDFNDIFKKDMPTNAETTETTDIPSEEVNPNIKSAKREWKPNAELLEGLGDVSGNPVTYDKSEIHLEGENDFKYDIMDDNAKDDANDQKKSMSRAAWNIDQAKKRAGVELMIPENHQLFARFMDCAEDDNESRAAKNLDDLIAEVKANYPNFIYDNNAPKSIKPEPEDDKTPVEPEVHDVVENEENTNEPNIVQINVDKDQADKVVIANSEEYERIKKKREVQLNIIERANLEFSEIEEVLDDNEVDKVLSEYTRKTNDIQGALPASKYRATFTGLSYPEVIDLSYSTELNSFDGEKRKWTIAYNHTKNPSIGPWEEYRWYIDPDTRKKVKIGMKDDIPDTIDIADVHTVTKFDDFLMKTSFLDIEFILWKILCATTLDKEIIQIQCKNQINGVPCGTTHNWVYRPVELLKEESLDPSIYEDMEKTMTANSVEDVMTNYKSSFVCCNNVVTLPSSNIKIIFGHASAYDYLYGIYSAIEEMSNSEDVTEGLSKSMKVTLTQAIKGCLIPVGNKYKKISSTNGIIKILGTLNEVDFQALNKIVEMVIQPYNKIEFEIPNVVCPKCGTKDNIKIKDMESLLFIITQSLGETQVTLRHN